MILREEKINQLQSGIDSLKQLSRGYSLSGPQLKKLKDSEREIELLKAENDALSQKINRISTENEQLGKQLDEGEKSLADTVKVLVEKKNEITDCRELVEELKRIKVSQISEKVYHKGIFKRMKNIKLIELSVLVHENLATVPGAKKIKLQIVKPDGQIQGVEPGISLREEGKIITNYSSTEFEYKGERVLLNLEWQPKDISFEAGTYTIRYFIDDYPSGEGKLELKK